MRRLRLFAPALIASFVVHALLLGGADWLPAIVMPTPPEKLEPITAKLAAQRIDTPEAAPAEVQSDTAAPARLKPAKPKKPRHDASAPADDVARKASAPASQTVDAPASSGEVLTSAPASSPTAETAQTAPDFGAPSAAAGRFPQQITVRYRLYWGRLSAGSGEVRWQREAGRYQLDAYASAMIGPKLHYRSEGLIGQHGLVPERYQAWRDDAERESAAFDWQNGKLDFGDRDKDRENTELQPGAQDFVSLSWQLAITGGADLGDTLQITNGRKVYRYPLRLAGQAHYPDENGIPVLVVRSQNEGELTEFWLAPDFNNLPVKIVRIDKKKTIEQHATRIDINGKSVWDLPSRNDRQDP
ncbi:DUF3108 domain-containing protein [Crenobacter cavernae]|uniref:DUF3108 domain-containing protein n=1 Tax=Crenobacter cavernae TaxID=2290923 RepID=A0A345Y311_9NEIS|nr:DUF3108 domain-containing protein [Crenobacter cavernae]AXK38313.1 DUF3108 domain-containing protein [Crenobacter cavernae]